jgi:GDP-fucose transporter C1
MTLKYVDASMYQVARGLLLPITVAISGIILHTRPSLRILISCAIVTVGFFIGVFIDNLQSTSASTEGPSLRGVLFGVLSSCTTALHAVVIKRSLDAVKGNTLQLAWYQNTLSAIGMLPLVLLNGEVPGVLELLSGALAGGGGKSLSPLSTFIWGSALTVSLVDFLFPFDKDT